MIRWLIIFLIIPTVYADDIELFTARVGDEQLYQYYSGDIQLNNYYVTQPEIITIDYIEQGTSSGEIKEALRKSRVTAVRGMEQLLALLFLTTLVVSFYYHNNIRKIKKKEAEERKRLLFTKQKEEGEKQDGKENN